jgi:hypothetical protein
MATAKAKPRKRASSATRSSRPRSQATTRGRTATRSKSGNSSRRAASSSRRSNAQRSTAKPRSSRGNANGGGRIEEARKAVTSTAQDAGQAVGTAAGRAKVPLLAGGAALAGIAGGVAIGARGLRRRKVLGVPVPRRSVLKSSTKNLAEAAKEAGKLGRQMGELSSEVHKTREAMDDTRRSPIEVVLQGLTRRGQS